VRAPAGKLKGRPISGRPFDYNQHHKHTGTDAARRDTFNGRRAMTQELTFL
jgi:hypothetical protein